MILLIKSEWIKLRSVRSTVVLFGIAMLACVGIAVAAGIKTDENSIVDNSLGGVHLTGILFLVIGVQIIGQEFRFQTIKTTFSAVPRRGRVVIAKAIVTVTTAAVSTAIAIALAVPASAMIATHRGYHVILSNHETWRIVIGTWLTVVVLAVFGFGIGCALKQPVAGIVVALVWATLGEGLVGSIFHSTERWLPINALHNAYDNFSDPSRLQWYRGLLYCGGVGVAMAIIGAIRIAKTDA